MNAPFTPHAALAGREEVLTRLAKPDAPWHLVTVHGLADTPDIWQPVCQTLDLSFRSYQQLSLKWHMGVGEAYTYPDCGAVLREGWKQLPSGPKVVLTHSFGGNAFLRMMQADPVQDIAAVVLLSPYYKASYAEFTWPLFQRYVVEFERFLLCSIDARMKGRPLTEAMRNKILEHLMQGYSPASWVMFYQTWSTTPALDLSRLTMPCKVMAAQDDFSLLTDDVLALAKQLPDSSFDMLDGLGHFSLIENPGHTALPISSFLKERLIQ